MKHSSASGHCMCENLTKGYLLGKTLQGAVLTLGLVGYLALFKEIEQAVDPSDTDGQSVLSELIQKVENKIKKMKNAEKNAEKDTEMPRDPGNLDLHRHTEFGGCSNDIDLPDSFHKKIFQNEEGT